MAITRTQIARQLYQFGGGADAGGKDSPGGGDFGGGGNKGGNGDTNRETYGTGFGTKGQYGTGTKGTTDKDEGNIVDKLLNLSPTKKAIELISKLGPKKTKDNLGIEGYNMANIAGPVQRDFGPEEGEGGSGLFAPLASSAPITSGPVTSGAVSPSTGENLTRIAYRLMADGGAVIDDEPRQAYGLGSIVKKAARAVKKVAKSDIGKAAILGAVAFGIPGMGASGGLGGGIFGRASFGGAAPGVFGFGGIGNALAAAKVKGASLFSKIPTTPFGGGVENFAGDRLAFDAARRSAAKAGLGLGTKAGLGIAALSALPLLGVGVEEEDEAQPATSPYLTEGLDIAAIRANPRKFQGQAYRLMSEGGPTDLSDDPSYKGWKKLYEKNPDVAAMNDNHEQYLNFYEREKTKQAEGSKEPVAKKTMPLLDMDGMEKDYRETGGFVDIGRMEKADDVPARLSKNEFVFTADAVRNAGEGDIDKGAEVMYNMMKNLEAGGEVSEESQGLEGARRMFQTSKRLEEVL